MTIYFGKTIKWIKLQKGVVQSTTASKQGFSIWTVMAKDLRRFNIYSWRFIDITWIWFYLFRIILYPALFLIFCASYLIFSSSVKGVGIQWAIKGYHWFVLFSNHTLSIIFKWYLNKDVQIYGGERVRNRYQQGSCYKTKGCTMRVYYPGCTFRVALPRFHYAGFTTRFVQRTRGPTYFWKRAQRNLNMHTTIWCILWVIMYNEGIVCRSYYYLLYS